MPGTVFPAFLQLRHDPNPAAKSGFIREIEEATDAGLRQFQQFSSEANRLLDQAMTTRRNTFGSLDLGVDQLKAAAAAQQARALAAREVAAATALAAKEEGDYGRQARLSIAATEALAREETEAATAALRHAAAAEQVQMVLNRQKSATDLVTAATSRGTTASGAVINSVRSQRVAFVQLGQQLTDVSVQWQMGTRMSQIWIQQVPQMAFALSGLEGKIGTVARVLSGPLGAAFFFASAALGQFAAKMFDSTDAADKSGSATDRLVNKLDLAKNSYESLMEVVKEYNDTQKKSTDLTYAAALAAETKAKAVLQEAEAEMARLKAMDPQAFGSVTGATMGIPGAVTTGEELRRANVSRVQAAIDRLKMDLAETGITTGSERTRRATDERYALEVSYSERLIALDEKRRKQQIDQVTYEREQLKLTKERIAALKAYDDAHRASGSGLSGREIDSALARAIAERAGFQVNSANRSRAEQQRLYDRWVAQGRPSDNPVAVPGTSAHERGNALDIQFGAGVTPASIRKAFADEGVRLTKLLRERGHFHIEWSTAGADKAVREAEALARAQEQLREFGERSAESIARINERFDEQPRLIDQAAQATRQLDDIIAELSERKPIGFEQIIEDAEAAKGVIEDALVRPFRDLADEAERRVQIERLLTQGLEEEAAALEEIWRIEERLGPLTAEQEENIRRIVIARQAELEALRRLQDVQDNYLDATRSVRSELEALFAGKGNLSSFKDIFRDLKARTTVEALFGDTLRELDDWVKGGGKLETSVDFMAAETERAGEAALSFADTLNAATARLTDPSISAGSETFEEAFAFLRPGGAPDIQGDEIRVVAQRLDRSVMGLTPERYFDQMTRRIAAPLLDGLDDIFGTRFFSGLQGTMAGALYGYSTGGVVGSVLGGARGFMFDYGKDVFGEGGSDKIMKNLDAAMKGAQTGTQVTAIARALGIKVSGTAAAGSQIGGAIGAMSGIPGGEIIGSISGAIWGTVLKKLFSSSKKSYATLTGADSPYLGGDAKYRGEAEGAGGSVLEGLKNIADTLGAEIGSFAVSIGVRDGKWRVDPRGGGDTKISKGAIDFGEDQGAAIAYALMDAVKDGAIKGLRASTQRLLQGGSDLEKAVQDAVDFESVFKRLARLKDPVGAAMDELDKEFERLQGLFTRAGASVEEWASLEELYWLERDEIIKEATERSLGTLRGFLDELTIGNTALSLRDRKASALAAYTPLAARVEAGDETAYDAFAEAARALLDIERQMSGSQSGYFDLLNSVTDLTQRAVDGGAGAAFADRDSPFGKKGEPGDAGLISATEAMNDNLGFKLDAVNQNLGIVAALLRVAPRNYGYGSVEAGW